LWASRFHSPHQSQQLLYDIELVRERHVEFRLARLGRRRERQVRVTVWVKVELPHVDPNPTVRVMDVDILR
jgi:hypothetical protein